MTAHEPRSYSPSAPPDLSICIVNWNVRELLRRCLASIYYDGAANLNIETIVVDNASHDGSVEELRPQFPQVVWLRNAENVGFTRANNQALAISRGRHVAFLNPDTVVSPAAFTSLVAELDAHPEIGAIGPRLVYTDGTPQPSRRRFPTIATALLESTPLQTVWRRNHVLQRYYMEDMPADRQHEVDWLVGACIVARRETLAQIGGFDEAFFMYSEELDWCKRAKDAGWSIVYTPRATITHYEGQSSGQVIAARQIHFNGSKIHYFCKHHGRWAAEIVRWSLFVQFTWQAAIEGTKWLAGHKRALRTERLRAYWRLLRYLSTMSPAHPHRENVL